MKIRKGFEKQWKELVNNNKGTMGEEIIKFVENVAEECEEEKKLTLDKFEKIQQKQPQYESFSGAAYSMAKITLFGFWAENERLKEIMPNEFREFERNNPDFRIVLTKEK